MPTDLPSTLLFLGRLLLGGASVFAGLRNIQNADFLTQMMAARGVPQTRLALWLGSCLRSPPVCWSSPAYGRQLRQRCCWCS
jgi:putative oxidoreductase